MTARTHDLAAVTVFAVAVLAFAPSDLRLSTLLVALLANQLGGIAPDLDQPTAPFWRNLPATRYLGRLFGKMMGGHRFISHSLIGFALFSWLANLLLHFLHPIMPNVDIQLVWYAFMIGYLSHLVLDSLTKEGVPWLLPLPFKFGFPPLRRLRITTGEFVETGIILPGMTLLAVWLFASHYNQFMTLLQNLGR